MVAAADALDPEDRSTTSDHPARDGGPGARLGATGPRPRAHPPRLAGVLRRVGHPALPHDGDPRLSAGRIAHGRAVASTSMARPQPYFQQLFWAGLLTVGYLPEHGLPDRPVARRTADRSASRRYAEYDDYRTIDFTRLARAKRSAALRRRPASTTEFPFLRPNPGASLREVSAPDAYRSPHVRFEHVRPPEGLEVGCKESGGRFANINRPIAGPDARQGSPGR